MSVGASGWVVSVSFVGVWRTVLTSTGEGGGRAASAVAVASTAGTPPPPHSGSVGGGVIPPLIFSDTEISNAS